MNGLAALARMEASGFKLEADGGRLLVTPASRLTAEQRQWIAKHKAALMAALAVRSDPNIAELITLFDAEIISVSPLPSVSVKR